MTAAPRTDRARGPQQAGFDWARLAARRVSVADGLSDQLERMIADGTLAAGSRLPAERELALQLGVSRASVREALSELELKGLVVRRPGRGTHVSSANERPASMFARWSDDERTLREAMDLRATIEPPIAARAAGRATERDLQRLEQLHERMRGERRARAFAELDTAFHREIARAAHNSLLAKLIETALEWIEPSRASRLISAARRRASVAAHGEILAAIGAGDADGAAAAMARHLDDVARLLDAAVED